MEEIISIDKGQLSDINSILEIENDCFGEESFTRDQFKYLIEKAKGALFCLKLNNSTTAYVSVLINERWSYGRIYSIAVSPQSRGKGLAQLLINRVVEFAVEKRLRNIFLEVRVENSAAIALYKKNGFVVKETKENYYGNWEDAYSMCKTLEREL